MKWILSVLFLLATISLNAQSQKHFYCLTENETVEFAVKLQRIQDSATWQKTLIRWQTDMLFEKQKLIQLQQIRIDESDTLVNVQKLINNDLKEENKKLQEIIEYLTPKWYENKYIWLSGGIVGTVIIGVLLR